MALVATWVMNVNIDPGCSKSMDPHMTLGSNPGPDIILVLGGTQTTNISLFLTVLPSQICHLPQHMNHLPLFLPLFSTLYLLAHHNGTHMPGAQGSHGWL